MSPVRELNLKVNLSYGDEFLDDQKAQVRVLMFYFWGIVMPIICAAGLVGNILTIIVLFRKEMKSTTVYFLQTLAITDTGIIIGAILGLSVISITQLNPNLWYYTDVIYPRIFMPVNYVVMTLQFLNVWTTVAVSVERYIAICHPFSHFKICKKRNALIIIGSLAIFSIVYNLPRCFAITYTSCGVVNCDMVVSTDFGETHFYREIFSVWLYMILVFIVPLLLLIVLNTVLIKELMRMRKRRTVTNSRENSEFNMSVVLVLVVIVFIFCQAPGLVAQFHFLDPVFLLKWMCVSNTFFVLNCSVNFLIYTAVGKKFRKILISMFRVMSKHKKSLIRRLSSFPSERYSQYRFTTTEPVQLSGSDDSEESLALKGINSKE